MCSVCGHAQQGEIEAAAATGADLYEVAARFGVKHRPLAKHLAERHTRAELAATIAAAPPPSDRRGARRAPSTAAALDAERPP